MLGVERGELQHVFSDLVERSGRRRLVLSLSESLSYLSRSLVASLSLSLSLSLSQPGSVLSLSLSLSPRANGLRPPTLSSDRTQPSLLSLSLSLSCCHSHNLLYGVPPCLPDRVSDIAGSGS